MIQYQILLIDIIRIIWQTVGRIAKGLDGYRRDKGLDGYRRDHYLAPVKSHSMLNLSPLQIVEKKQLLRQISQP